MYWLWRNYIIEYVWCALVARCFTHIAQTAEYVHIFICLLCIYDYFYLINSTIDSRTHDFNVHTIKLSNWAAMWLSEFANLVVVKRETNKTQVNCNFNFASGNHRIVSRIYICMYTMGRHENREMKDCKRKKTFILFPVLRVKYAFTLSFAREWKESFLAQCCRSNLTCLDEE